VKAFLDTSVLVAVFYGDHVHHEASLALFLKHPRKQACCGAHSLAEVYSTLTRMPPPHRLRGEQAMLFLNDIQARLSLVALDGEDYFQAINEFAERGVIGGAVYDGILARCALKAEAESIYTWNVRHYRLFGPEVQKKLRTP
jgi:predicted nucleic acid-binding protein